MLDDRLRVLCSASGAHGITRFINQLQKVGSVVTAYSDQALRPLRHTIDRESVDIVPFGQLVARFCQMWGIEARPHLTTGHREAIIGEIVSAADEDNFFAASARFPGTRTTISSAMRELEHAGWTSELLSEAAQTDDRLVARRLKAILEVAKGCDIKFDELKKDSTALQIHRSIETSGERASPIKHVICLVMDEDAALFDQWFLWLARTGVQVDIILDPRSPNFQRVCNRLGVSPPVPDPHWTECLFTTEVQTDAVELDVFRAADPLAESEWAIRAVWQELRRDVPSDQIAILTRNLDQYAPLLIASAERFNLSFSASVAVPLLSNGLISVLVDLITILSGNDIRELIKIAPSTYLSEPGSDRDALWDQLRAAYARGSAGWDELENSLASGEWPWIPQILEWRRLAMESDCTLVDWRRRLTDLAARIEQHSSGSNPEVTAADRRAQNVIQRGLVDQFEATSQQRFQLKEFGKMLRELAGNQTLHLPSVGEGIHLVSDARQLPPVEVLIVVGAVEGSLPKRQRQDPVLNDSVRRHLNQIGPGLTLPESNETSQSERADFAWMVASASRKIVMAYPHQSGEGLNSISHYAHELARAIGKDLSQLATIHPSSKLTPERANCITHRDAELADALRAEKRKEPTPSLETLIARDMVKIDLEQPVSLNTVADYYECPFKATMRHRFHLYDDQREIGLSQLRKLPELAMLPQASTREQARERLEICFQEMMATLFPLLDPWSEQMLRAAATRLFGGWVEREFVARETWEREFPSTDGEPEYFLRLGERGTKGFLKNLAGVTVRFGKEKFFAMESQNGRIIRLQDSSVPPDKEQIYLAQYHDSARWLRHGLLICLAKGDKDWIALEIESDSTDRLAMFYGATTTETPFAKKARSNPGVRSMSLSLKANYLDEVKNATRQAIESLVKGSIAVRPSEKACKFCQFGALCRSKSATLEEEEE